MRQLYLALFCVLLLAGCTKAGNNGIASANGATASAAASQRDDPAGFATCMQSHGQSVPAPPTGNGDWAFDPHPRNAPAGWDEALRACQHFLPMMMMESGPGNEEMEQLRAFAVCMRAHDIPITDPQIGGDRPGNMNINGRFENVTREQLEADPAYQAALAACKDKLPQEGQKKK